jgi:cytochrome c2
MVKAVQGQSGRGQKIFQSTCSACHTIGGGRLVGPDLHGVTDRHNEKWIIRFVQHSQQVITSGDAAAAALFKEYQEIVMPDQPLSADEIEEVVEYIRGSKSLAPAPAAPAAEATEAQTLLGRALFQGKARFTNSGPTCISCHNVKNDSVTWGGALARELTEVHTRVGNDGIRAILASPPFPVMQRAYRDNPLTEDEIVALVGFLTRADEQQALQRQPQSHGSGLLVAGMGGAALLLVLYSLTWSRRLKGSVNQRLYDRQIKST